MSLILLDQSVPMLSNQPLYCLLFTLGFFLVLMLGRGHSAVLTFYAMYTRRSLFAIAPEYILEGVLVMENTEWMRGVVKFYRVLRNFHSGKSSFFLYFIDGMEHAR